MTARSEILDSLRGFALLGILLANFEALSMPVTVDYAFKLTQFPAILDRLIVWLVAFLIEGKFILIFSFLFGYGLRLQMARAEREGADLLSRYRRRMATLFAIGFAHALLLFFGDVLMIYAILGAVLLAFRDEEPRRLVRYALGLWLASVAMFGLIGYFGAGAPVAADDLQRAVELHRSGSFGEIAAFRFGDMGYQLALLPFAGPLVLAAFLVGLAAAKSGLLQDVERERGFWRFVLKAGLPLAIGGNLAYATGLVDVSLQADPFWNALIFAARELFAPLGSAVYIAAFALLFSRPEARALLRRFAPNGRMSLSVYVGQSLLASFLFLSYGLGWYGSMGPARGMLLMIAVYLALSLFARLWLRRFPVGPLEAIVQRAVYGARPPARQ